jgi:subtilisin-like proprotein convertase family protein
MKNLIKTVGAVAVALVMTVTAQATLYTYNYSSDFANAGVIPDGNVTGWSDTRTLSGITDLTIQDVNVRLNISGGYNGDLYGYLVHDSGFAVLLDRVGTGSGSEPQFTFGFATSGFGAITLDDNTSFGSIHDQLNPADGTWKSDGVTLNSFNGGDPNGTWTLFLADMAAGDTSTLVSWGLDIEAVPEPITWALLVFGGVMGSAKLAQHLRRRKTA